MDTYSIHTTAHSELNAVVFKSKIGNRIFVRREATRPGPATWLTDVSGVVGRTRLYGKGMDRPFEFLFERGIDVALSLQAIFSGKRGRNNLHPKMRLPFFARADVPRVICRFINYVEFDRCKGSFQLAPNLILH